MIKLKALLIEAFNRFPAVKTKDGRVFIGRIHADAVAKTGDAELESTGWWFEGRYYPEEESRKMWGKASTDDLEPELKRAWRLHQQVPGVGDDPVNVKETHLTNIERADKIPSVLFHATFEELVNSIAKNGLVPSKNAIQNFAESDARFVYLAISENGARHIIEDLYEADQKVQRRFSGKINVLKIRTTGLAKNKFYHDPYSGLLMTSSFMYMGHIPTANILDYGD